MNAMKSHIAVFAINVAMLAILYWQIEHVDIGEQQTRLSEILRLETLELSLDREVFRLSARRLKNYDSIAALKRQRSETLATLQTQAIAAENDPVALTLLASAFETLARSDRTTDHLLRSHALLRNSEALFPSLLSKLNDSPDSSRFGSALGLALYQLGQEVSAHDNEPTADSLAKIIEQTESMQQSYREYFATDLQGASDFENLLEHARIIATEALRLHELKSTFLNLSLVPASEELYRHYSEKFVVQQEQASNLFPLFHFIQAVLVVHIVILFVLIVRSNSHIAGQARALQANLKREQELSSLQRQFVLMVSHEFRTPLTIIDAIAQRILRRPEKNTPDRLKDSLSRVRNSVRSLVDLMESVLSVGKLEDGRIQATKQTIDLSSLVGEVAGSYRQVGKGNKISIDVARLPTSFYGDPTLLRQVVSNVVSNAIKYSPDGTAVTVFGQQCDGNAEITVWDDGVGIPAEELGKLFERFYRASTSTGIAGSGIGLHLVQHLVEMHDGRIEVESTVGEGTAFTVFLPIREEELPTNDEEEATATPRAEPVDRQATEDLLDDLAMDPEAA